MKYRTNAHIIRDLFSDCDDNARDDVIMTLGYIMTDVKFANVTNLHECVKAVIAQRYVHHNTQRTTLYSLLRNARSLAKQGEREAFEYCEQYVEIYKDEE